MLKVSHAVDLSLVFTSQEVSLEIQDDGKTSDKITATSGFGLAGMLERANLLGGEFTTGANPEGGFLLRITLPLEKEA